jgi:hypothetical protein
MIKVNLDARWRLVANFTLQLIYCHRESPQNLLGGLQSKSACDAKRKIPAPASCQLLD